MNTPAPARLSAMMGSYPKTEPLKSGALASELLALDFAPVDTAQKAFKQVVREHRYDVAELAIMTFLQAFDQGQPYVLLPFVMNGHFHHKSILCRSDSDLTPQGLAGKRVAMRAYTQTTPAWVRGILGDEYGVRLQDVRWLSQEGAHVADYQEPAWVQRLDGGASLDELLLAGEVDAIISGGAREPDPRIRTLIPDAPAAALRWHQRTGAISINHMVAVRREIAEERPGLVRELMRLLQAARAAAGDLPAPGAIDLQPVGFDAVRTSLELAVRYAHEQALIGRRHPVEQLYGAAAQALA